MSKKHTLEYIKDEYIKKSIHYCDNFYNRVGEIHNLKCLKCDNNWKARFNDFTSGYGCPFCANINRANKIRLSYDFVVSKYLEKDIEFLDVMYLGAREAHSLKCLKCKGTWKSSFNNFFRRDQKCPYCFTFTYESLVFFCIKKLLGISAKKKCIQMKNCDFQKRCIVDFYFNIKNLDFFVEYNGGQHYKPVCFGYRKTEEQIKKSIIKYEQQVKRDEWLRNYCIKNNIILIEIDGRTYITEKTIEKFLKTKFFEFNILEKDE